jgi:hypothetical protein
MAVVYITEYARQGSDAMGHGLVVAEEPPVANQTVAIGATTAQSSAFNASTTFVRVHTDAICGIEFGTNPTATTTTRRMPAGGTEYFAVPMGKSYKLAVITNT